MSNETIERYYVISDGGSLTGFPQIHDCEEWIAVELSIASHDLSRYQADSRVLGLTTYGAWEKDGKFRQIVNAHEYRRKYGI